MLNKTIAKKTTALLLSLVMVTTFFSGCWNRRELEMLSIVLGIGIDQTEKDNQVEFTMQIVKTAGSSESGGGGGTGGGSGEDKSEYWNAHQTGEDPFEIFRDFPQKVSRKTYISHNQLIIFGKDLAEQGVQSCIDVFLRDHETRLNIDLLVARGKAADVLDVKPTLEATPATNLVNLLENQKATPEIFPTTLFDFLNGLLSETTCTLVPMVDIKTEEKEKLNVISGAAVFRRDKMVGELTPEEIWGVSWVTGKVKSGALRLTMPSGTYTCEITTAKTKVTPEMKEDGSIVFKVKIVDESNIVDQMAIEDMSSETGLQQLEKKENELIKKQIEAALKKAFLLKTDIFGFGDMLNRKFPAQWKKLKEDWNNQLASVEVQTEVITTIKRTGRIIGPAVPAKE